METLKATIKTFLTNPIHRRSDKESLDFKTAKENADQKAKELCSDPILLAWYQGKTGDYVPKTECGVGDKPAWIIYAESRGGDITLDINDEEYIFIPDEEWNLEYFVQELEFENKCLRFSADYMSGKLMKCRRTKIILQ